MNTPHEKVFTLQKPEIDLGKVMPQSRRSVAWNKTLSVGARLFYCILFDYSVYTGKNMRQGVVRLANSFLARRFGVSIKTIRNWKTELRDAQLVFMTERAMANTWPMTVYHFPNIIQGGEIPLPDDSESDDGLFPEDETETLSNRRRSGRLNRDPKTGKWLGGGSKTAQSSNGDVFEKTTDTVDRKSKNLPPSRETSCPPPRQPVARDNGNQLPATQETSFPPRGKPVAVVAGKPFPATRETSCRGNGKPIADKGETQVGGSQLPTKGGPPPDVFMERWIKSLEGRFPSHLEKMRERFKGQLKQATEDGRAILKIKLAKLDELLDGPQPGWVAPKAPLPVPVKPKQVPIDLAVARKLLTEHRKRDGV